MYQSCFHGTRGAQPLIITHKTCSWCTYGRLRVRRSQCHLLLLHGCWMASYSMVAAGLLLDALLMASYSMSAGWLAVAARWLAPAAAGWITARWMACCCCWMEYCYCCCCCWMDYYYCCCMACCCYCWMDGCCCWMAGGWIAAAAAGWIAAGWPVDGLLLLLLDG